MKNRQLPMHPLMMLYFAVCALAMIWPGATLANKIEPMVMGLPFFLFWYLAWLMVTFVGLIICYKTEEDDA
ncbi:DUF3311 domain-containing protein [Vibrio porteresiae]|uniref:DUF3311 domain-containing protein n=1 Tax=Vibrio porteresiae DSM 19223 TaxID=1123496 RepID=A0ABZ0QBR1_9VIBR|nr:DUF3311 domain-containing protein [Vibrio porteresiae]WPC73207.1 DUF3311 domain-containing protein [Vibrio porteresiae DSM 19223]